MACGIPVISADCKSGPREILAPGSDINMETKNIEYEKYGVLIPVCNGKMYKYDDELSKEEELLSKSIVTCIMNPDILDDYSKKTLIRVKNFSKESIIDIWEDLI
jgi:glycosyltransferase involved in cell wall biosynthesis